MKIWKVLTLLLLAAACSTTGSETTQSFSFEYADADPAPVVLEIRTGTLNLTPVNGNSVQGQVTTNVESWRVSLNEAGGAQRVVQGQARNDVIPRAANRWDVSMGTGQPLALTINSEAANANLELGGLALRDVTINGTTGSYDISYSSPNAVEQGGRLSIQLTSGDISVDGLLNSHVSSLQSVTTGGSQTYEFGGNTLTQNLRGNIETTSGDITLRIPEGTAVRIMYNSSSGRVMQISPEFTETNRNVFETAEYAEGVQPHMQLSIRTVAGDLRVISVPPL